MGSTSAIDTRKAIADPALKHRLALKLDLDEHALSGKTLFIIQEWIKQCIQTHKCDSPLSKSLTDPFGFHSSINDQTLNPLNAMPTRLIQLNAHGADTWDCKLVDFQDGMVYSALTYCWGETQKTPYTTTKETIESMRTRIVFEELPNTLQHAIGIAKVLGLTYLWVDVICIIHWDHESTLIGGIYSNAYVTIAADIGNSTDFGCIDIRPPEQVEEVVGTVRIPSVLDDGTAGALYFYIPSHVISGYVTSPEPIRMSPLSERGWCFQERILSKRILHYTKRCVYWECRDLYRSEDNVSLLDTESSCKTLPSTVHIFEDGLPGSFQEMTVGVVQDTDEPEPGPPNLPPKRK